MNNRQLLTWMISTTNKLCEAANDYGTESPQYQAVLDEIHEVAVNHNRQHRRRSKLSWGVLFFLFCFIAWLLFECARLLIF